MLLSLLPNLIVIPLLVVLGAIVGAVINWAIYSWCYFSRRPFSPWMKCDDPPLPRTNFDRVPLLGWFSLRRHASVLGRAFWIRPFLIELTWAIGLPWFWLWQTGGGLTGGAGAPGLWFETWFWGHAILIALMFIATFIDFDEKMIPDEVTVVGTLIALLMAAVAPWSRLPQIVNRLAGPLVEPIHYASSNILPTWHYSWIGILVALAILAVWLFALLPGRYTMRYGIWRGLWIVARSIVRPQRKTSCSIRTTQRGPHVVTKLFIILWLIVSGLVLLGWLLLPLTNWTSLFGAIVGLGFGGGLVWTIRIVASYAMQQEAMGFGDVTLMAMIGAFLGWQSSLLIFAIAPFAALVVVAVQLFVSRQNEMAFGPYLCIGALVLLFQWHGIWHGGGQGLFFLGPLLLVVLLVGLICMAILLFAIQWVKSFFVRDEGA